MKLKLFDILQNGAFVSLAFNVDDCFWSKIIEDL